jgi:hypothetical protein
LPTAGCDYESEGAMRDALGEAPHMSLSGYSASGTGCSLECRQSCRFEAGADVARCKHAMALRGALWAPSCCSACVWTTMDSASGFATLIASGDLPLVPPLANGTLSAPVRVARIIIGRSTWGPCLICGEADPMVSYTYADRKVVRLHARLRCTLAAGARRRMILAVHSWREIHPVYEWRKE